jgi:hypothetical protein
MDKLIILLIVLAIIHFMYDQILLPTFRLRIRSEIFELRDQLRTSLIEYEESGGKDKPTLRAYKDVDDIINRTVNRLHLFTLVNILKAKRNITEADRHVIKKRHKLLESVGDKTPIEVYQNVGAKLEGALGVNSLISLIYLLPFILIILALSLVIKGVKAFSIQVKEKIHSNVEIIQSGSDKYFIS